MRSAAMKARKADKMGTMNEALLKAIEDYGKISEQEIADRTRNSHIIDWKAAFDLAKNYNKYHDLRINDKYKHALISCLAAQRGTGSVLQSSFFAGLKELKDVQSGNNTLEESYEDDRANRLGRLLGFKNPQGNCDEMVSRYIKRK